MLFHFIFQMFLFSPVENLLQLITTYLRKWSNVWVNSVKYIINFSINCYWTASTMFCFQQVHLMKKTWCFKCNNMCQITYRYMLRGHKKTTLRCRADNRCKFQDMQQAQGGFNRHTSKSSYKMMHNCLFSQNFWEIGLLSGGGKNCPCSFYHCKLYTN